MVKKAQREASRRNTAMPYVTSEMAAIMEYVQNDVEDTELVKNIHFSPTALTLVRHVMMSKGAIITDTALALSDIDRRMMAKLGVHAYCFIDDPQVVQLAEQKCVTRAEIALDHAMTMPGLKLVVIGSAPSALNRLLQKRQAGQLNDVVVLAAPTGFASVVQLKERLWDSDIASIVVRGKKGGANIAVSIINGLLSEAIRQQNL